MSIKDEELNLRSDRKEIFKYFDKRGCPYCGRKHWAIFDMSSGYESHWSDSDIRCRHRDCRFMMSVYSKSLTLEEHYNYVMRIAHARYKYLIKEHKKLIQSSYAYLDQIMLYKGDNL